MADDIDLDDLDLDIDLSGSDDLFPAEVSVDGIEVTEYTREQPDVDALRAGAFGATIGRWAGQLNTIDLAAAVKVELEPLTSPVAIGTLFETCMVKLGLDILSGNLKPKSVREATGAIEALERVRTLVKGGAASATLARAERHEIFRMVHERVEITGSVEDEPTIRNALEAEYVEDD